MPPDTQAATRAQLAEGQRAFRRALEEGPAAVPFGRLMGAPERLLRAFAAHANTVNHARLTALETCFPLCVETLGQACFLDHARRYLASGKASAWPLARIHQDFPEFLQAAGLSPAITDLACVERAWLESHGAADADALTLAGLAELTPEALFACGLRLHPAVRVVPLACAPHARLSLPEDCRALAVVRPEAEVRLLPLSPAQRALIARCEPAASSIGTLVGVAAAHLGEGGEAPGALAALVTLVESGAFVDADREG